MNVEKVSFYNIIKIIFIEIIIDNSYSNYMKFSDVLYDGSLPNNKPPVDSSISAKEKKKQQKSFYGMNIGM